MMAGRGSGEVKILKDAYRALIWLVLLVNLAVLILAVKTGSILIAGVDVLVREWRSLLPAGFGAVVSGVLNEQLNDRAKARLVFWRWNDPLPGSDAFSVHLHQDPRIDVDALTKRFGPFPTVRKEQNARWYAMYRSVENEASVVQVHRNFLFTRDYTGLSFMLLVVFGAVGFWQISSLKTATIYFGLLLAQYFVVRQAAKNNGIRFVTTVLALKAIGK
jgi:hypothetical protein